MNKPLGMWESPEDKRDFLYSSYRSPVKDLPSKVLLPLPKTKNQLDVGWCVGFAASSLKDIQEKEDYAGFNLETSPSFIYAMCKMLDGVPNEEGTFPRIAMKVIKKYGVCLESTFPFLEAKKQGNNPIVPHIAKNEARKFKISSYVRIRGVEEMRQALAEGKPILGGLIVTDNFLKPEGEFVPPIPEGRFLGGHAILIAGYDDNLTYTYKNGKSATGFFKLINSWGEEWGKDGCVWIPYDFLRFKSDIGMTFFNEAWTSIDILSFDRPIKRLTMTVNEVQAEADDIKIVLDQAPILVNNRTLVPMRQTCELFGERVIWIESDRSIEVGENIKLWIGRNVALVNGRRVTLDQPPIIDSTSWRTLIPLRFVAEILGYNVGWNEVRKEITITK